MWTWCNVGNEGHDRNPASDRRASARPRHTGSVEQLQDGAHERAAKWGARALALE